MISLKFPPMQKLVGKDTKELPEDDPKKGVTVLSDHAIVVTPQSLLFFNLKDYFIKTNNIDDDEIMQTLSNIMDFMHGKMFTIAFWEELTKGAIVSVENDVLELDGAVRKDLFYKEKHFDATEIIQLLGRNVGDKAVSVPRGSMYVGPIFDILNNMKGYVKNDSIAFEYVGVNTMVRFTFQENPWLFGLVASDPILNSTNFLFGDMAILYHEISGK